MPDLIAYLVFFGYPVQAKYHEAASRAIERRLSWMWAQDRAPGYLRVEVWARWLK